MTNSCNHFSAILINGTRQTQPKAQIEMGIVIKQQCIVGSYFKITKVNSRLKRIVKIS